MLIRGERPVFVDFYATWCAPCKAMEPVIARLSEYFAGQAIIVKVNIDQSPDLAASNGVRGVPTFMLFAEGKAVERVVGITSEKALAALITPHVERPRPSGEPVAAL